MSFGWWWESNSANWMINPSYYYLIEFVVGLSLFIIVLVILIVSFQLFYGGGFSPLAGDNNPVELLWTIVPSFLICCMCYMNIGHLDNMFFGEFCKNVKIIGRQWYWSYWTVEVGDMYDSVITDFIDGVDKPLRLKYGDSYIFYVTSSDVIHSFSIPFLGLKADAIPGRVNQILFNSDCLGSHVGYCTELCGAGHAYMPIVLEVIL